MKHHPIVWTIAGSDSGGGAGIQADLHTFRDFNCHGCSVITAITAQNSHEVIHIQWVDPLTLEKQLTALHDDLPPKAIKLGMLGSPAIIQVLLDFLKDYTGHVVLDPVLVSTSGSSLSNDQPLSAILNLLPYVDLITPNYYEAALLGSQTVQKIETHEQIIDAAEHLLQQGAKHVLIKGGHAKDKDFCQDYYTHGETSCWITSPRQPTQHNHGTGCTLSSAIAANWAQGHCTIKDALVLAKAYVHQGLRLARGLGAGPGPCAHAGYPNYAFDTPWITATAEQGQHLYPYPISSEDQRLTMGLYPIVSTLQDLENILPLPWKHIQLRIKNQPLKTVKQWLQTALAMTRDHLCCLWVNDHWQAALELGAKAVHLGQHDVLQADLKALQQAGIRWGISCHSETELAQAIALSPAYIGFGPIFTTQTKRLDITPRGLERLRSICHLSPCPVVAIGGIHRENLAAVFSAGAAGAAVIGAIQQHPLPYKAAQQLYEEMQRIA